MPTLLVVDDSPVDRRMVGGLLEQLEGFEIWYAENGEEALAQIERESPDLIVTDLQMPDMDGLELVTNVQLRYPKLPVILITAHGSEDLATSALRKGAASYVPKDQLGSMLVETVEEIFAIARADRTYERLIDCSESAEFVFRLDNDAELIEPLADLAQRMIASMGVCPANRIQIGVAMEQALRNAVFRGNLEIEGPIRDEVYERRRREPPYDQRTTHVRISIDRDQAMITIADEGPGFDVSQADLGSPGNSSGRGLVLMTTFMDEVKFNDKGNEVTMVKCRRQT